MNAATITALCTALSSVIIAVTALLRVIKHENTPHPGSTP